MTRVTEKSGDGVGRRRCRREARNRARRGLRRSCPCGRQDTWIPRCEPVTPQTRALAAGVASAPRSGGRWSGRGTRASAGLSALGPRGALLPRRRRRPEPKARGQRTRRMRPKTARGPERRKSERLSGLPGFVPGVCFRETGFAELIRTAGRCVRRARVGPGGTWPEKVRRNPSGREGAAGAAGGCTGAAAAAVRRAVDAAGPWLPRSEPRAGC